VTGVAAYPLPGDDVPGRRGVEPLPEIDVLHRLLVGGQPASLLPAVDPLGDAVAQILAIAVEPHAARALQRLQPRYRSRHLHPVIGRVGLVTAQFLFNPAIAQNGGPAPGARVAAARAIGKDFDFG